MRHYVLGLFYVLDNTPFPHAKYKCDIMNWGYLMLYITPTSPFSKYKEQMRRYLLILFYFLENIPFFPNTKVKPDIIYWCY